MILNNPYYYHPQPALQQVADDVLSTISRHPQWDALFQQGKMLGIFLVETPLSSSSSFARVHYYKNIAYLVAYSGVVNGLVILLITLTALTTLRTRATLTALRTFAALGTGTTLATLRTLGALTAGRTLLIALGLVDKHTV